MKTRRQFFMISIPAVLGLASTRFALADAAHVDEASPTAKALGYMNDASKVDAKKFPTYAAGHVCGNCQLYQGKAADAWATCPIMGGNQVNAKGWCSAWVKKAG
ncbi:hypothetical protein AAKU67_000686 [Oxalobacteraceae bacterium GrIS 2.11]